MTLNCTKRLTKRLPFPVVEKLQPDTNKLGPWCANAFNVGRAQLIIMTNERSLLSVLIPFKEIRSVHGRFLLSLEDLFFSIGLSSDHIQGELSEMKVVQFNNNTNRRTLGSMNDFVNGIKGVLQVRPDESLQELTVELSKVPCAPLRYGYPREAVLDILDPPPHIRTL